VPSDRLADDPPPRCLADLLFQHPGGAVDGLLLARARVAQSGLDLDPRLLGGGPHGRGGAIEGLLPGVHEPAAGGDGDEQDDERPARRHPVAHPLYRPIERRVVLSRLA